MKFPWAPRPPSGQWLNPVLAGCCVVLAMVLPAAALYGLCTISDEAALVQLGVRLASGASVASLAIQPWQWGVAIGLGMLPVCAIAYGLLRAGQCFRGFGRGEIFSLGSVRHLRGFATGLLLSSIAGLLVPPAMGALLTLGAPAGGRSLSVNLGSQQLLMLLFAGIVWQIAHAMARAVELAEDHAQIV